MEEEGLEWVALGLEKGAEPAGGLSSLLGIPTSGSHDLPFSPLGLKLWGYHWLSPITTDLPSLNTLTPTCTTQLTILQVLEMLHLR